MHIRDSSLVSFSGYICMFSFVMLLVSIENLSAKAVYFSLRTFQCYVALRIGSLSFLSGISVRSTILKIEKQITFLWLITLQTLKRNLEINIFFFDQIKDFINIGQKNHVVRRSKIFPAN